MMFDQLRSLGSIASILKDRERLRDLSDRVTARLDSIRAEGSAGAGAVRVVADGRLRLVSVHVDPAVTASLGAAREQVEALIAQAANDALAGARARSREAIERELKDLGLSDLLHALPGFAP